MLLLREDDDVDLIEGYIDLVEIPRQWLQLVDEEFVHLRVLEDFVDGLVLMVSLGLRQMVLHVKIL